MGLGKNQLMGILFILTLFMGSCGNDAENFLTITGTVKYVETYSTAKTLPIKLSIYDLDKPFDRSKPDINRVLMETVNTDDDGIYTFVVNRGALPNNASYSVTVGIDSLLVTDEFTPCFGQSSGNGKISNNNRVVRDILVDYPAYLQLTFDKVDHLTSDRVRFYRPSCILAVQETTIAKPDTTVLETLQFSIFNEIDIGYFLLRENEEMVRFEITDIVLIKNDTVKLKIEY